MDDQAPKTPASDDRHLRADEPVPDPHRNEPLPPAQEGTRPGADPAVRPEQDEPNGPLAGLVGAASADVQEEATGGAATDPAEEALLAQMGVEDENIASGQLLGLVVATLVSVIALGTVLIYLFYIPYRGQVSTRALGAAENTEQVILRTEAVGKLGQYTRTDSTYGLPISRAMGLVAVEYGSAAAAGLPDTRQEWNGLGVTRGMGQAIQATPAQGEIAPPARPLGDGDEEVGVDDEGIDLIETVRPEAGPDPSE